MRFNFRLMWIAPPIAFILAIAIALLYTGPGVAMPKSNTGDSLSESSDDSTAILTATRNQGTLLNGVPVISGVTVLSGAAIENADRGASSVYLNAGTRLDLDPNTKVILNFNQIEGVKLTLLHGCATLLTKQTPGEITTPLGIAAKARSGINDSLNVCFQPGSAEPIVRVSPGTALVNSVGETNSPAATATTPDQTRGVIIGAIGEVAIITAVMVVPCNRGRNPSPGVPRGSNDCH